MATGKLRFAALIRVSTEKQSEKGESLRTQDNDTKQYSNLLGGKIVARYGGQEHATPNWEKGEVDRLIRDAALNKFDAVIVSNVFRWSRDNVKSKEGLAAFLKHRVRFFVGMVEFDLFSPQHKLFLGMSAEIGEFNAGKVAFTQIGAIGSGWTFVETGDFLAEGRDEFLIQNASGVVELGDLQGAHLHLTQVASPGATWLFH